MVPRSDGIHRGTILTVLNRAIMNGLVTTNRLDGAKKPYLFELTDGGRRRVKWIRGAVKVKTRPATGLRAVANPKDPEEE
jgi:DNA-binding PadR family transcriptional regulator